MRLAIVAATFVIGLAGCASAETAGGGEGDFPSLREVPTGSIANTDAAHWAAVEAELRAAGQELRSSPRAQPATAAEDPAAFLDEARRELDEARQSHEPN